MLQGKLSVPLPRRITGYFMLFSVIAVMWLGAGAVLITRTVTRARSESATLLLVGRATSQIGLEYLQHGTDGLQRMVAEVAEQQKILSCAVASPVGTYLAHSRADEVGQASPTRTGRRQQWDDVERVRYTNAQDVLVSEYRSPLAPGGKTLGTLIISVAEPGAWGLVSKAAGYAPLAILGPACCIACGSVLVGRMVQPVAEIEQQLAHVAKSPSVEGCQFREVASSGAAAIGWNRVLAERITRPAELELNKRLRQTVRSSTAADLDTLLNSLPDGLATTDAEGRVTFANVPMATILEIDQPDGTGQAPQLLPQLERRWQVAVDNPLAIYENADRAVVTELHSLEGDERRILRVGRYPVHADDASPQATHVWSIRDVTQQKLADEKRDQFVDTATHELRTPLANIKAYAETLALTEMIDVEQQKQFLNTINSEASRLARFVDDLLSVSSMEVGSLSLTKGRTDLQRMFAEVVDKVQGQMEEKELTFTSMLPERYPEPNWDKDKIAAVLVNLLGNAAKYTPAGGRVTMRVVATDEHLEVSVEDTGMGIPESELPRVFEKFFRSEDPRVQEITGTGLGLSLSQEVVRLHGGKITVESEVDKGSTFKVTLPLG